MENNVNGFDSMFEEALRALDRLVESAKPKAKEQIEEEERVRRAEADTKDARKKSEFDEMARMMALAYNSFINSGFDEEQAFTLLLTLIDNCSSGGDR